MNKIPEQKLEMQKRRITLPDGRYLIYFDFIEVKAKEISSNRPQAEKTSTEKKDV